MKLSIILLHFSSLIAFSHEVLTTPKWIRNSLEAVVLDNAIVEPELAKYSLQKFKINDVEADAESGISHELIQLISTLIESKSVVVYDPVAGHEWSYCAGLFSCEFPNSKKTFKAWIGLGAIKADADPNKFAQEFVKSSSWKGIKVVKTPKVDGYLLGSTICENAYTDKDGITVYFLNSSYVSLDETGNPQIKSLPFRSCIKKKETNGFYEGWAPFSESHLVTTVRTTVTTGYGDNVTDIRYFFYHIRSGKEFLLPLVFNIEELAKEQPIVAASGKKYNAVTEALERPIKVYKLKAGTMALRLFLPKTDKFTAGEYLLIPNFE